ncbi:MAG TPA: sigma 54-interacting transcriptional regulator [Myxococcota bacterium]|nr:sigma 54-interacting transcriptional regulator [Myxococcota bacterium]
MPGMVRAAVVALVGLSLGASALIYHDIQGWIGRTYPGFMMFPTGAVASQSAAAELGLLEQYGLRQRDWIESVDGVPTPRAADVYAALADRAPGDPVRYQVRRPRGERFEITVPARAFAPDMMGRFVVPLLIGGLFALLAGALGVLVRPDLGATRVLFLFCWSGALTFFLLVPDLMARGRFVPWLYAFSGLFKASLLHLAATFPQPRGPFRGRARTPLLAAVYTVLFAQSAAYAFALGRAPRWIELFDTLTYATVGLGVSLFFANVVATARRGPSERLRQQARVALIGPALSLLVVTGLSIAAWITPTVSAPTLVVTILNAVFAVTLSYAMLRHNLFEFDIVLRRGLAAAAVLIGGALVYLGLFVGLGRLLGEPAAWVAVALGLGAVAVGVPGFWPLGRRVEQGVASLLFPGMRAAEDAVAEAGSRLVPLREPGAVAECVRELVVRGFRARTVRVLQLGTEGSAADLLEPGFTAPSDGLAAACRAGAPIDLDAGEERTPPADRELLAKLDARVLVPLPVGASERAGALACGPRSDGRLYTREDVEQLESLAAQTAVALANASAWERVRALQERLAEENALLRAEISLEHGFDEIVGVTPGLRGALAQVEQVAPTDATVLVIGETGTGKELIVRALHHLSPRSERPLVKVACGAIPETLLESELFGHERGAFTGADRAKLGRIEAAEGGTLFFDDVDALPLSVQAKLLRAIQEGEVQRLGSGEVRKVDVRVIAATNRDLLEWVREGRFREDLYYRLHVVPVELPPLRERRGDIRRLAEHFVAAECKKLGREPKQLSASAVAALEAYDWPGNVRELRNVIERAVVLHKSGDVELPEALQAPGAAASSAPSGARASLAEDVREFKMRAIGDALARSGGNQRVAAEALGMHRQSLTRMIRELGMRSEA